MLDGYCQDHCIIQHEVSRLYKSLSQLETKHKRAELMAVKRYEILKPLVDEISKTSYFDLWHQLCFEICNILKELYE